MLLGNALFKKESCRKIPVGQSPRIRSSTRMKLVYITSHTNNQGPAVPIQAGCLVSVRECQWDPFFVWGRAQCERGLSERRAGHARAALSALRWARCVASGEPPHLSRPLLPLLEKG